jgi:uncharacterized iron-regulated protein
LAKSTNYEAPRYAAFSTLQSLYPSKIWKLSENVRMCWFDIMNEYEHSNIPKAGKMNKINILNSNLERSEISNTYSEGCNRTIIISSRNDVTTKSCIQHMEHKCTQS